MSATITSQHHHRMPLIASLSVAGVIAAAGAVGVVWHESTSSTSHDQAPAQTRAQQYQQYSDGQARGGRGLSHAHGRIPGSPDGAGGSSRFRNTVPGGRVQLAE